MQPARLSCTGKRHYSIGSFRLERAEMWAGSYIQLPHCAQIGMANGFVGSSDIAARDAA